MRAERRSFTSAGDGQAGKAVSIGHPIASTLGMLENGFKQGNNSA